MHNLQRAEEAFREHGGILHTSEALALGIHPRTLYRLREMGKVVFMARGLYRLEDAQELSEPDLVTVAAKTPRAVICLISALAFHRITTEIPHRVSIALPRGYKPPKLTYPPLEVFWFSEPAYSAGVETHILDDISCKMYSVEKTVADCFKFRNKIGLDVAIEALKLSRERKGTQPATLMHYARLCRVERVMKPYLEALL
jgi:predicted transcriptional regulator of viral defense system